MTDDPVTARLLALRRAARRRRLLIDASIALPPIAVCGFAAARVFGVWGWLILLPLLLAAGLSERRRLRRQDLHWLARRLNARLPALDDSSALLLAPPVGLSALSRLQQERLRQRLHDTPLPDLRPALPWRRLAAVAVLCALLAALLVWQPWRGRLPRMLPGATATHVADGAIHASLHITPPAYTQVDAFEAASAEASFPAGSRVRWQLRFPHTPASANLRFRDGTTLALRRDGAAWTGEREIAASALYRIDAAGSGSDPQRLYRLEARADQPPEIIVRAPDKTLNLLEAGQTQWRLAFAAHDDYGLGVAELSISLAQGSGEQIKVSAQTRELKGEGSARDREYHETLDLAALGLAQGDDLIVRLTVADKCEPTPNLSRSASFILRWPPETDEQSVGMEGLVGRTLPAYFRSQRQIIIDTEALLARQPELAADTYTKRANAIGDDQKILRLRYGQFLGEESEGGPDDQDHDAHAGGRAPANAADAAEHEYGHVHDIPGAATLIDDATKKLLRSALDAMWSAEGKLRTARLPDALPDEHRALEAIKQVQQATRIYLARAGLDPPPIDPARRLTGDRSGLADPPASPLVARDDDARLIADTWRALDNGAAIDVPALDRWLRAHPPSGDTALDLLRSADELRRAPACTDCRDRLKVQLWPLLPPPATALLPRAAPDAATQAYRQALQADMP